VEFTPQGMGKLLCSLGLSSQRSLVRAYEQDPERPRHWKEEDFPAIHAEAVTAGARIFFGDEDSVRTDCYSGTTWAPVGRTPIIQRTSKRLSVNMISAISLQGKMHFTLLHNIPGTIFLIVDGRSARTATATKQYVAATGGRITLFFLPLYSPELNPTNGSRSTSRTTMLDESPRAPADELKDGIEKAIDRLQRIPEIVSGFFRDPDLSYIHL